MEENQTNSRVRTLHWHESTNIWVISSITNMLISRNGLVFLPLNVSNIRQSRFSYWAHTCFRKNKNMEHMFNQHKWLRKNQISVYKVSKYLAATCRFSSKCELFCGYDKCAYLPVLFTKVRLESLEAHTRKKIDNYVPISRVQCLSLKAN